MSDLKIQPFKRRKRRRSTKRRSKSDYKTGYPKIKRGLFAKRFGPVSLKYHDQISINPGAGGTPAWHIFSANGMYDPDNSGGGHQPYGFDQYMAQYEHYTVLASKAVITFNNMSNSEGYVVVLRAAAGTTLITDRNTIREAPQNISTMVVGTRDSAKGSGYLQRRANMSQFLSQDVLQEDANAGFDGIATGNPAEQVYWHVGLLSQSATADGSALLMDITIEYIAVFHEPKPVTGS